MLAIGSDHAGFELKAHLIAYLSGKGIQVKDMGCPSLDSVDYPDVAHAVAEEILSQRCDRAILICGTGIGISMAANRYKGIRAALCNDEYCARMTRQHNDANVLALGARVLGIGLAESIVDVFLTSSFEGGKHAHRIDLIDKLPDAQ